MLIAALFGAVRMRPGVAAIYGMFLGLVADALTPRGFGAAALGMTVVAYAASWLKAVFFADNLALNAFFLFVGKWVFDVIVVLASRQTAGSELVMQIFVWSPLAAALTAVAGAIVLTLLRPIMELRPT
jgi:rod shape-determining protein MreD